MIGELLVWLGVAATVLLAWTLYISAPYGDEDDPAERSRFDD